MVVPTRDRAHLLPQTLLSVLRQRDVDLQLIVVDDGSTDETGRAVERIDDERLQYLRHDISRGVSAARNAGIAHARGRWVAFLDDDDLWAPSKLADQLQALQQQRLWALSGAVCVDGNLRVLSGERPLSSREIVAEVVRYNSVPVGASNVIVRRDALEAAGPFDVSLRHMADWDLWIRLAQRGPPAVVHRPHVAYRLHLGSATVDTGRDGQEPLYELGVIARRYGIPADQAAVHRWIGWSALRAGRRGAAVGSYLRAAADGDATSLLRAVVAALHPRVGQRTFYSPLLRERREDAWSREARAWLHDLAAA